MVERIYMSLWGILLLAGVLLYLTGSMTVDVGGTFIFVAFSLIFMGMIGVLPHWVTHRKEIRH